MNHLLRPAAAVLLCAATLQAHALTITYQGQLRQSGAPFTGLADLEFRLYDQSAGGTQIRLDAGLRPVPSRGRSVPCRDFSGLGTQ